MPKEYDAWVDNPEAIPEGQEVDITIRELTPDDPRKKYKSRYVRAVLFRNPDRSKDDILWVRYQRGSHLYPEPFGIRIIKDHPTLQVKPTLSKT